MPFSITRPLHPGFQKSPAWPPARPRDECYVSPSPFGGRNKNDAIWPILSGRLFQTLFAVYAKIVLGLDPGRKKHMNVYNLVNKIAITTPSQKKMDLNIKNGAMWSILKDVLNAIRSTKLHFTGGGVEELSKFPPSLLIFALNPQFVRPCLLASTNY